MCKHFNAEGESTLQRFSGFTMCTECGALTNMETWAKPLVALKESLDKFQKIAVDTADKHGNIGMTEELMTALNVIGIERVKTLSRCITLLENKPVNTLN